MKLIATLLWLLTSAALVRCASARIVGLPENVAQPPGLSGGSEALPDLIIRQVVAVTGDDRRLRAHIVNIGNADAGGCTLSLFYQRNGQTVKRGTYVTPIARGKDLWVDVNNDNPIAAASSITLRVDDPNRVKESDELNNSYKFK